MTDTMIDEFSGAESTMDRPGRWPSTVLSDSLEFGPLNGSVSSARLHARAILGEWGYAELRDSCETVVAELVANAVEAHQREGLDAPVRLILLAALRTVLIVVRDASNAPPVPGSGPASGPVGVDDFAERGRGLLLVEAFSSSWGWKFAPGGGKAVRALIRGERR